MEKTCFKSAVAEAGTLSAMRSANGNGKIPKASARLIQKLTAATVTDIYRNTPAVCCYRGKDVIPGMREEEKRSLNLYTVEQD